MIFRYTLKTMLAGFFCFCLSGAYAQEVDNRGNIYLGALHYKFDNDRLLDDDTGIMFGIEIPYAERWSMAIEHADFFDAATQQGLGDADFRYTRVGVNYHLDSLANNRFQPYLAVGFGGLGINRPTGMADNYQTALDVGIGLKQALTDNLMLRWDVKSINPDGFNSHDLSFGLSIGYAFGQRASTAIVPVPEPEPEVQLADSDNDGIVDRDDVCPNTPANRPVDATGCEVDSDADSVADVLDSCPNTPQDLAVDMNGCPVLEETQLRQVLDVQFAYDSTMINPQYRSSIADFAEFMEVYTNTNVVIEGHTDSMGSEAYNQDLSERRAMAVRESLINDYDIPETRISIIGYGESNPTASNDTEEGRAQNRRIEAEISVVIEEEVRRVAF